jgi:hypothetical protein
MRWVQETTVCQEDQMRSVEPRRKCLGIPASDLSASSPVICRDTTSTHRSFHCFTARIHANTATGRYIDNMVREDLVTSAVSATTTPGR